MDDRRLFYDCLSAANEFLSEDCDSYSDREILVAAIASTIIKVMEERES